MNTNEISEYLNRELICSKIFYGVYPANKIPKLRSLPALIVCNTDTSSRPGEHFLIFVTLLLTFVAIMLRHFKHSLNNSNNNDNNWIVLYVDDNRRGEYLTRWVDFQLNGLKHFYMRIVQLGLRSSCKI